MLGISLLNFYPFDTKQETEKIILHTFESNTTKLINTMDEIIFTICQYFTAIISKFLSGNRYFLE